jgi:UDP-N-acetylmuramate dehydrogenase
MQTGIHVSRTEQPHGPASLRAVGPVLGHNVPLAPMTTLELGGPARFFVHARSEPELCEALALAQRDGLDVFILGGGSNLVVSDAGFDGLVIRLDSRGIRFGTPTCDPSLVRVAAGEPWDRVVERTVDAGLAGLECLSGIPGSTGATPIQNVGAYGREIAEFVCRVRVLERATGRIIDLAPEDCAFGYRDSALKRAPQRWVVLSVELMLARGEPPVVRYAELSRALGGGSPSPQQVRQTVLALRRRKSMVIDSADPNHRSAGSFFTNPIVTGERADAVVDKALDLGLVTRAEDVPRFCAGEGAVKLAAGWLIEKSGVPKGLRHGHVGVSSNHALALVHHGGGTTAELLELASYVRDRVEHTFGIRLVPEPVLLGARF